ncbi:MAG: SIS domain-containing protein [Phycisphaera sp.]|nr:SIS domain-containing protein [Phycisphaera sp.]
MTLSAVGYCDELARLLRGSVVTGVGKTQLSFDRGAQQAVETLLSTRLESGKALVIGNGGSAAIASHLHNDLSKAVGLRSMVFTEPSLLTALTNDEGYERAYEFGIEQWAEPGDVLIAISSSGRSENILRAVAAAASAGCRIITLSGFAKDNPLRQRGDLNFYIPSSQYGYVELAHSVIAHYISDAAMAAVSNQTQHTEVTKDGNQIVQSRARDRRGGVRRRRASA